MLFLKERLPVRIHQQQRWFIITVQNRDISVRSTEESRTPELQRPLIWALAASLHTCISLDIALCQVMLLFVFSEVSCYLHMRLEHMELLSQLEPLWKAVKIGVYMTEIYSPAI